MNQHPPLQQLEANLRAVGRQARALVALAHFDLFISPAGPDHMTFAVPLSPDPPGWAPHVADLKAAFAARGKRPRLEFISELHPHLAPALDEAGLVCASRAPVMTLALAALAAEGPPTPAVYRRLDPADEPFLRAFLLGQGLAYGGEGDASALDWLPILRGGLRSGDLLAAALVADGRPLAGATLQLGAGIAELAGVWTDPQRRNQGLAFAVCRRLLADYAAAGHTFCWLSAATGAQRLYARLGFAAVGTQLNYAAPSD
jgi:ribosomal protein S18 acetylase RimI-like enzyme